MSDTEPSFEPVYDSEAVQEALAAWEALSPFEREVATSVLEGAEVTAPPGRLSSAEIDERFDTYVTQQPKLGAWEKAAAAIELAAVMPSDDPRLTYLEYEAGSALTAVAEKSGDPPSTDALALLGNAIQGFEKRGDFLSIGGAYQARGRAYKLAHRRDKALDDSRRAAGALDAARNEIFTSEHIELDTLSRGEQARLNRINASIVDALALRIELADLIGLNKLDQPAEDKAFEDMEPVTEHELREAMHRIYATEPVEGRDRECDLKAMGRGWRVLARNARGRKARRYTAAADFYQEAARKANWWGSQSIDTMLLNHTGELWFMDDNNYWNTPQKYSVKLILTCKKLDGMVVGWDVSRRSRNEAAARLTQKLYYPGLRTERQVAAEAHTEMWGR